MESINLFISYSWDSDEHKDWVKSFADKLEEFFEINVSFDQYDLDSSDDKNYFMEKSVFGTDIILMIATDKYVVKANNRLGGVGIETKLSTSRHWEESEGGKSSKIIPILRQGESLPNYLKEKFYLDFRNDSKFSQSFNEVIDHIKGTSKSKRPSKKHSLHKSSQKNLTKIEDFLKINHKKRNLVFEQDRTTDFSANQKIKFELWETKSPSTDFFLFIFDNVTLKPTIERLCGLLKEDNLLLKHLTVLKSKGSEKGYLKKLFQSNGIKLDLTELSFSDYIWDYCIDDEVKTYSGIYKPRFFIDQPLLSNDGELKILGPAFEYLKKKLNSDTQSPAKIIIAPGGTGKTTLCQFIVSEFQDPDKAISVFIQSEDFRSDGNIDYLKSVKIESVYDLYEVYSQVLVEHGDSSFTFNRATFEVALLTGRLVLVIDGMDEIISIFPEGFNLNLFLQSINNLNNELALCKIVITSRNDVFDVGLMDRYDGLNKYYLFGFDIDACNKYLGRRFRDYPSSEDMTRKVIKNITPLISSDEHQRILPFVVDLLSTLVEDSISDGNEIDLTLSFEGKKYESNNDITDYLIYSVLRRESERQKIEIEIEDVIDIFLEISSTHKDSFAKSDFIEVISIFCSEDTENITTKILRNPLICIEGETCRFKYNFISDYFKALNIIHSINSKRCSEDFLKLIAKYSFGDNEVICNVSKYFNNHQEKYFSNCREIILGIKKNISYNQVFSKKDFRFKAIGFFVKLASILNGTTNSKKSFKDKILDMIGEGTTIENLAFYGDNSPIDFSDLSINNSKFIGYKHFSVSKFYNTTFTNCYFDSCYSDEFSKGFNQNIFKSCRLGDLEGAIESAEEKSDKNRKLIEKEMRNFLSSFFHRGHFTDKKMAFIKISTRIKSINRAFLNHLIRDDVIYVKIEKSDDKYFAISPHYESSVYGFLINNKIDKKIESLLSLITL